MQTPERQLSTIEPRILNAVFSGDEDGIPPDWLAMQRLKIFGLVEFSADGRPLITDEGKRVHAQAL